MGATQLQEIYLPFHLGLLFPSPRLFPHGSVLILLPAVSPQGGVLGVDGSQAVLQAIHTLPWASALRGFRLAVSVTPHSESGSWGPSSSQICWTPLCSPVLSPARTQVFLPLAGSFTSLEFGVCALRGLLVLCKCCPYGLTLFLWGHLGRSKCAATTITILPEFTRRDQTVPLLTATPMPPHRDPARVQTSHLVPSAAGPRSSLSALVRHASTGFFLSFDSFALGPSDGLVRAFGTQSHGSPVLTVQISA